MFEAWKVAMVERDLGGDNRKNYAQTYREVVTMPGGLDI